MRRYVHVLALCLGLAVVALAGMAASPGTEPGTVTIDNPAPHYGDTVTFTYHVERRYREMVGAVLCWQSPGQYNYIGEWSLGRALDGTFSGTIAEPYPPNLPPFDKTRPATCIAYVFREPQSANSSGAILTSVLTFEVQP